MPKRIAALVASLVPGQKAVRLLPAGEFRSADGSGRPTDAPAWRIDADSAAALVARHAARQTRRIVDYEHQTLRAADNGKPAPAAGWIESLEWREGDGLYAVIEWTAAAAAMIAAGEYRYISPVFPYDKTGRVLDIRAAALTNDPGLDGLTDLAALTSLFPPTQETPDMELKKLLLALGLADDKTEAEALTALAALKASADSAGAQIAALTAQAAQPDPAKFVPIDTHLQTQNALAALTSQVEQTERDGLMTAALADGRILPAQDAYWRAQPVAALTAYLAVAQPVAALGGTQTGGKDPSGGKPAGSLTNEQLAVCTGMNIKPEDYLATLSAQA